MRSNLRVAQPPSKPLLIFDGECRFCRQCVGHWRRLAGGAVDYQPFQEPVLAVQYPEIPRSQYEAAAQLIVPDGRVYSGAEAVFRSLAYDPRRRWLARRYDSSPLFARLCEWAYRFVSRHRAVFSWEITRAGN
jgi:predicted DCC family thiol-disulfide oxidoreductase YuxK